MNDSEWLADQFEEQRPRLRSVAYRMLGSITEADDALQDAWLRVNRAGADDVDNMNGWLTTIVARVCLNMLRARNRRREEFFEEHLPDPIVSEYGATQPEEQALLADSVGLALLVVLDTLTPAERLAFVLHDMFELPFDEIAPMVDRTPEATRQLASRARRRVKGAEVQAPDPDLARQREVVDAFFAAPRGTAQSGSRSTRASVELDARVGGHHRSRWSGRPILRCEQPSTASLSRSSRTSAGEQRGLGGHSRPSERMAVEPACRVPRLRWPDAARGAGGSSRQGRPTSAARPGR